MAWPLLHNSSERGIRAKARHEFFCVRLYKYLMFHNVYIFLRIA